MGMTPATDKVAIQAIISTDDYIINRLRFDPNEIYRVRAVDKVLDETKKQIFIWNARTDSTENPLVYGLVYEVDVSVPYANQGTADLAIEQIVALLRDREISNTHKMELQAPPTVLSSDNSLYQIGVRFVVYSTVYNKIKK